MDKLKKNAIRSIVNLVNKETQAWNSKNTKLLMSLFHEDMVWPWPPSAEDYDPINWIIPWGRYNYERWSNGWQELFNSHDLIHNKRIIRKIKVSNENDGGFAVVDIDTLWKHKETGIEQNWKGRTCKIYTKLKNGDWKFINQYGVLNYDDVIFEKK